MRSFSSCAALRPLSFVVLVLGLSACSEGELGGASEGGAAGTSGVSGQGGAAGSGGQATGGQATGGSAGKAGQGGQAGASGKAGQGGAPGGAGGQAPAGSSSGGQAGQAGASGAGAGGSGAGAGGGSGGAPIVPLFVAQGHLGRTTVSCDDGKTWIADRSDDDAQRCWAEDNFDCDHKTSSGNGVTWGGGYFYATFGWGEPGAIRRSVDGFHWETALDKTTYNGLAYAGQVLLASGQSPRWTTDGTTWSDPVMTPLPGHARVVASGQLGGLPAFAMAGDGPSATVSTDGGKTWLKPDSFPAFNQGEYWNSLAIGGEALVAGTSSGRVIRSTDGGKNWTVAAETGVGFESRLLWTGKEFVTWASGKFLHSADGVMWTTEMSDLPFTPGVVARGPTGTYAMVNGGWQAWYEKQQFARSEDGTHWTVLPAGAYKKSHPMRAMTAGQGVCPSGN